MAFKRISKKPLYFGIPVVSIGNLVVGGSGKTPVAIALAKDKKDVAIVLRGYGRGSKGLYVVSQNGDIKQDVNISGDEAQLLANSLPKATVIVSENRVEGILKAKELGCKVVYLDDGYNKFDIAKLDILIRPFDEPENIFCLPSGGYRDTKMMYSFADIVLKDGVDFKRVVTFKKDGKDLDFLPQNSIILTAISKPQRLLEFIENKDIDMVSYPDHYNYTKKDIDDLLSKYPEHNIITTAKDKEKLEKFNIPNLILMNLEIEIVDDKSIEKIDNYIKQLNNGELI